MCGITGIFNTKGRSVSTKILQRMNGAQAHRGPDGEGVWIDGPVGLGHRRLAILDLSPAGRQPMQSQDGRFLMVYNGEVYNYQNLRVELEALGHTFHTQTDSEVVLAAYQAWGLACVDRFNGMFAFAIWDQCRKELVLARDRYGIKPLYYYYEDGTFLFGSEIKAMLQHPDLSVSVSITALNEYFSFQNIFSDLTLCEGVRMVPPAHTLTVTLGATDLESQRYWDYDFNDEIDLSEEECLEEFSRLFEQAISRQLVSDVEVGSYLSGGIDSGSVTSVAAEHFSHLKTFTCGFDLSSVSGLELSYDERRKAEYLSYRYKTEHYEVVLKAGDMERVMPDLIWHLEDPRVGQSYPNYYIARLASKFVKVVLSGAGGDELFAGYPWRYYRAAVCYNNGHYIDKYYGYWQRLIDDRVKSSFYRPHLIPDIQGYQTKDIFKAVMGAKAYGAEAPEDYVNRSLYFEAKTFLHGLLVVEDKLSMAHGLETRVPFLDNDLVDFAMRVPIRYKLRNLGEVIRINENEPGPKTQQYFQKTNDGKNLLRKAATRYVPEQYANGTKQGFSAPDGSWFKGESIDYIQSLLFDKRARMYDYIQPETAQAMMKEHFCGQQNKRLLIWSFLCFEWWLRTFMD